MRRAPKSPSGSASTRAPPKAPCAPSPHGSAWAKPPSAKSLTSTASPTPGRPRRGPGRARSRGAAGRCAVIRLVLEAFGVRLAIKFTRPSIAAEHEAVDNTAADVDEFGFRPPVIDARTDRT